MVLPVLLLLVLGVIDFGRAFYSWITVTNAARVGANYASLYPGSSFAAGSEYDQKVRTDALNSTCPVPVAPAPTFVAGKEVGDPATVQITCSFGIITPVLSQVLGGTVQISASATFPIRSGPFQ